MYTKFLELPSEKKEKIINACFIEFAQNGYDKASTNVIVKNAGISKGLLFHYFKNKKQLYLFLYDHSLKLLKEDLFNRIDLMESDFFEQMRNTTLVKFEMMRNYPGVFDFIQAAYLEQNVEIKDFVLEHSKLSTDEGWDKLFENVDLSKFKEGLDIVKTFNTIRWTFEAFGRELMKNSPNQKIREEQFDGILKQVEEYIEYFKILFYK